GRMWWLYSQLSHSPARRSEKVNRTVRSSSATTSSSQSLNGAYGTPGASRRLTVKTTSSAVSGSPSCHRTSSRSRSTYSSSATTSSSQSRNGAYGTPGASRRLTVKTTSSAVSGSPSCHRTPSRSLSTYSSSETHSPSAASHGSNSVVHGSNTNSVS